jgi:hypothetical protein
VSCSCSVYSEIKQAVRADGRDVDDGNGPQGRQSARDDAAAPRPPVVRVASPHARPRPAPAPDAPPAPAAAAAPPPTPKPPPAADQSAPAPVEQQQQLEQSAEHGAREAADERVHGVVAGPAAEDGPGEPQDAQLGDLEAARRRVEAAQRSGEEAVHRRSEEAARRAHEGAPRLQVPAAAEDQNAPEEGQVPAGRVRPAAQCGPDADGAVGRPTGGEPRHVPDAERVHAQRVHDARPRRLPAAVRRRQLRPVRHEPDAVHERRLRVRHDDGPQQRRLPLRDAAGLVAQPVGLQHQVGAGVAELGPPHADAGRRQKGIRPAAAAPTGRPPPDDLHVPAHRRDAAHAAVQCVAGPAGPRALGSTRAHVRAPVRGPGPGRAAPVNSVYIHVMLSSSSDSWFLKPPVFDCYICKRSERDHFILLASKCLVEISPLVSTNFRVSRANPPTHHRHANHPSGPTSAK